MFIDCLYPCVLRCYKAMDIVCATVGDGKAREICLDNGKNACKALPNWPPGPPKF